MVRAFTVALGGLERAYIAIEAPYEFITRCNSFKEQYSDVTAKIEPYNWYLKRAEPASDYTSLSFSDDFGSDDLGHV